MMTNQKNSTIKPARGRPKTNPISRAEQVKKNSETYRAKQAQKKRDLKNKVNQVIIPNLVRAIELLENGDLTRSQRIEQVKALLELTAKQWDQEIHVSINKGQIQTYHTIIKEKNSRY